MTVHKMETALTVAERYQEWDGIECRAYETEDGCWAVVLRWHSNQPANVVLIDNQGQSVVDVHSFFGDADFNSDEEAIALALRLRRTTPGASP